MKSPVPLQFLVGLTRLIAVYFAMRALDQLAGALMSHAIQVGYMREMELDGNLPSVWGILISAIIFYGTLVASVWFSSPFICRLAVGKTPENQPELDSGICWNHVMIFLVGVLLVGWGLARISDWSIPRLLAGVFNKTHELTAADSIVLFTTAGLIGFGVILMARFPSIYRWMQRRNAL